MISMSIHSEERAAQRNLTREEIEYVLQFGKRYHCNGGLAYFLREKDLPPSDHRRTFCTRLIGTSVVLSNDRLLIITVWRNRKNGLKWLRKKAAIPAYARTQSGDEKITVSEDRGEGINEQL